MEDQSALLQILAMSLNIPIESFYALDATDEQRKHRVEIGELVEAFEKVEGHIARRRCIDYVKAVASAFR
ncbi:hypothetical protein MKK65_09150 [Methylobacterium sp. J-001]|uniref:hypothetical protein n=1 Tax=Methylobacterium sp. J-001 TaxID=2836609 RepID=UPI001FB9C090|nr:hypothetical protein [Methylobacterium sp. J-001]MCJ2116729.1 hypothetical protein [Methylobacterium sp. J-001]